MTSGKLDFDCLTILTAERDKLKRELRRMPKGKLMIQMNRGRPEFFRVTYDSDGIRKRNWVARDDTLVYKLAHKAYLEEKLRRAEFNIKLLEKPDAHWLPMNDQAILTALPKYTDLLDFSAILNTSRSPDPSRWPNPVFDGSVPIEDAVLSIGDMDIDEWAAKPYCANTKFSESKIHRATNGLLCRSKGEAAISELCNHLGYRYHYDETILIGGRLCSPDFIIARTDGSLVYLEHRGWQGEAYDRSNMAKDNLYFEAGIRQGSNYLITFENPDGGINLELVEMQLRSIVESVL